MEKGFIHIYCGDGKGKTTAAVGLAMRMAGSGGKVLFFQFLKNNSSCERKVLSEVCGIRLIDGMQSVKFTFRMNDDEKAQARDYYEEKLSEIEKIIKDEAYDMVVLDEIIGALDKGLISRESVLMFLDEKPESTEVIMTGRNPCAEIVGRADYITEMKKIRHPFDEGIKGRTGIEF